MYNDSDTFTHFVGSETDLFTITNLEILLPFDVLKPNILAEKFKALHLTGYDRAVLVDKFLRDDNNSLSIDMSGGVDISISYFKDIRGYPYIKFAFNPSRDVFSDQNNHKMQNRIASVRKLISDLVGKGIDTLSHSIFYSNLEISWDCVQVGIDKYGHLMEVSTHTKPPKITTLPDNKVMVGPDFYGRHFKFSSNIYDELLESGCSLTKNAPDMRVSVKHDFLLQQSDLMNLRNPFEYLHCFSLSRKEIPTFMYKYHQERNFFFVPNIYIYNYSQDGNTKSMQRSATKALEFKGSSLELIYPEQVEWPALRAELFKGLLGIKPK